MRRAGLIPFVLIGSLPFTFACAKPAPPRAAAPAAPASPALSELPPDEIIEPEELIRTLGGDAGAPPLVLHVGPEAIFTRNHVPGAHYVGMASTPEGLSALQRAMQGLPHDTPIVIYCGCCPWARCPNVRPAIHELERLGFTRARVLDLPHNFQTDWATKGLPIRK